MNDASPIDLRLDEENSLVFEVSIQGDTQGEPMYRFVCDDDAVSYSFRGIATPEGVRVIVPPLMGKLKEGLHDSHLEVIIDSRIFIPLRVTSNFEVPTRVVVEGVRVQDRPKDDVSARAQLLDVRVQVPRQRQQPSGAKTTTAKKQQPTKNVTLRERYDKRGG